MSRCVSSPNATFHTSYKKMPNQDNRRWVLYLSLSLWRFRCCGRKRCRRWCWASERFMRCLPGDPVPVPSSWWLCAVHINLHTSQRDDCKLFSGATRNRHRVTHTHTHKSTCVLAKPPANWLEIPQIEAGNPQTYSATRIWWEASIVYKDVLHVFMLRITYSLDEPTHTQQTHSTYSNTIRPWVYREGIQLNSGGKQWQTCEAHDFRPQKRASRTHKILRYLRMEYQKPWQTAAVLALH